MLHCITTPQPKEVKTCDVCRKRPGQAVILGKLVCGACFAANDDPDIQLYRRSLAVVKGGLPG